MRLNTWMTFASFCFGSFLVNAQKQTPPKDSLVVSFISIGAGTDHKAKDKLDNYVKDFQSREKTTLTPTTRRWGKEGEVDYTYPLNGLSRKQCKAFVEGIEVMFRDNQLVKISHPSTD